MANDFLITFTVDGNQAIQMMQQIGQVATQTQAQINALNNAGRTGGGGGILNNLGLAPAQVQGSLRSMQSLADTVNRMAAARQAASTLGLQTGAGTLKAEAIATQQLSENYAQLAGRYANLTNVGSAYLAKSQQLGADAKNLAAQSKIVANQLDDTGQAFGRHARRVFEGILVYEAFGRAVQAVSAGIKLVVDIDRESRRLTAVLGTTSTATAEFVGQLGKIASATVTPFEDLVAEADSISAAFLNIEDPTARAAAALELAGDAGAFTSITQHSLAEEVGNLTAIMKQFHIPVEQMADFLGKITVAGGNSSVVIAGLTDALRVSAQAAEEAGVGFDKGFAEVLLASESQFLIATKRTGSEVGNVFKILITRLADPDVVNSVEKITNGMLKLRDASGAIRNPLVVLAELNALVKTGAINVTQFNDAFEAFAPPLQPARVADFKLIARQLEDLGPIVSRITTANASDLDKLVKQINDGLGPQFQKLIIDAQRGFVELFGPGIIALGFDFINVLRTIGSAIASLPTGVITAVVGFTALLTAFRLLVFAGKGLGSLLGIGGLLTTIRNVGVASSATGAGMAAGSVGMSMFGRAGSIAGILIGGLISQLKILLPLIAIWMAIDFAGKVGEMQGALQGQLGSQMVGKNLAELQAMRERIVAKRNEGFDAQGQGLFDLPALAPLRVVANALGNAFSDDALDKTLIEIDKRMADLKAKGPGAKVVIDDLSDSFKGGKKDADIYKEAIDDAQSAFEKMMRDALANAEGFAEMSDQEKIAAQSASLLSTLIDEQADALLTLNDRLKDGKITQEQWTAGQDIVNRSAQIASDLVAALGDGLRTMIPELGNAGAGTEALAGSLFKLIINSSDSIGLIESVTGTILQLAAATGVAAQGLAGMTAAAVGMAAVTHAISTGQVSVFNLPAILKIAQSAAGQANQLQKALAQLRDLFAHSGGGAFGASTKSVGASKPQTPILDIGDLPPDQVAKLIALATTLRNAIPGETAADKNSIVALIKDAAFLQTVKGIDDRLLRIALEELTATIKEQIDLQKKQDAVLSNLAINAGPLGALISAPNIFGVGGSIPAGLNFDPNNGNFTVNIDIGSVEGMTPEQISALIEQAVRNGIREGLRMQGVV